jgi:hypothetical protein
MYVARAFESRPETVRVSYELQKKPAPKKGEPAAKNDASGQPMLQENIEQKGEFFYAANPHNARIAIYETRAYSRYGSYQVSGRKDMVDVYLQTADIAVVDLVTGKTLFKDTIGNDAKQSYTVPANIKQGDVYVPTLSFDRREFLPQKVRGLLK